MIRLPKQRPTFGDHELALMHAALCFMLLDMPDLSMPEGVKQRMIKRAEELQNKIAAWLTDE